MLLLCGTKARNNSFPLEFKLLETGNKDRQTFGKEKHGLSTHLKQCGNEDKNKTA
jgi:hypothetical protein